MDMFEISRPLLMTIGACTGFFATSTIISAIDDCKDKRNMKRMAKNIGVALKEKKITAQQVHMILKDVYDTNVEVGTGKVEVKKK